MSFEGNYSIFLVLPPHKDSAQLLFQRQFNGAGQTLTIRFEPLFDGAITVEVQNVENRMLILWHHQVAEEGQEHIYALGLPLQVRMHFGESFFALADDSAPRVEDVQPGIASEVAYSKLCQVVPELELTILLKHQSEVEGLDVLVHKTLDVVCFLLNLLLQSVGHYQGAERFND